MTNQELHDFFSRPRRPAHELPDRHPFDLLEEFLRDVHESPADRVAEFHRVLFLNLLCVAVVPEPGGTVQGVKHEGHPWRPFVRHDGKLLLFSSLSRAYDGLPRPTDAYVPGQALPEPEPFVPVVHGFGFQVLPDLADFDLVLNPFSRHSWRLPRQEVAELLRRHVVGEPLPLTAGDLPTQQLRPLWKLPAGLADSLRSYCVQQNRPQARIRAIYVVAWDLPDDDPEAGLAVFVLTDQLDGRQPRYLAPIAAAGGARPSPPVRFFYLDPQLLAATLPRVAAQLRTFPTVITGHGFAPPYC